LLEESLILRYKLLNDLKSQKFNYFYNLTLEQLNILTYFVKNKPFKIVDCDKNLGVAFVNNSTYKEIALEHLNSSSYRRLENNPLENITKELNSCLLDMFDQKHISKKLYEKLLIVKKCSLGKFRVLVKVHKDKFGIRPIVNCSNCRTH